MNIKKEAKNMEFLRRAGQNSIVLHRFLILNDLSTGVNSTALTEVWITKGLGFEPFLELVDSVVDRGCQD
jgi:hypothetical protein